MAYRLADLDYMARTIWAEARGEPFAGQLAVGWVIRNRAKEYPRWPATIVDVCLQPKQFSCWNEGDPNRQLIAGTASPTMIAFDPTWDKAVKIALAVLMSKYDDPTLGSNHYFNPSIPMPIWAVQASLMARIGRHEFYKL